MKTIQDIYSMTQNVAGQKHCEEHNETYNLIETPGGIVGSCPLCWKKQMKNEDAQIAEKAVINKDGWQVPFIEQKEWVSDDLTKAKVNNYKPVHETQEQAKRKTIDYIKTFNGERSLIFSGKSGNGKSHLAYAITKAVRQLDYKAWFIKTRDLLKMIRETYRDDAKITEDFIFRVIKTIDLLVLDDVGSEYVRPVDNGNESWASDILYAVFEERLNKATVCTTNYTMTELEKKYGYNGERINSRMLHKAETIRLQGEDYRIKGKF